MKTLLQMLVKMEGKIGTVSKQVGKSGNGTKFSEILKKIEMEIEKEKGILKNDLAPASEKKRMDLPERVDSNAKGKTLKAVLEMIEKKLDDKVGEKIENGIKVEVEKAVKETTERSEGKPKMSDEQALERKKVEIDDTKIVKRSDESRKEHVAKGSERKSGVKRDVSKEEQRGLTKTPDRERKLSSLLKGMEKKTHVETEKSVSPTQNKEKKSNVEIEGKSEVKASTEKLGKREGIDRGVLGSRRGVKVSGRVDKIRGVDRDVSKIEYEGKIVSIHGESPSVKISKIERADSKETLKNENRENNVGARIIENSGFFDLKKPKKINHRGSKDVVKRHASAMSSKTSQASEYSKEKIKMESVFESSSKTRDDETRNREIVRFDEGLASIASKARPERITSKPKGNSKDSFKRITKISKNRISHGEKEIPRWEEAPMEPKPRVEKVEDQSVVSENFVKREVHAEDPAEYVVPNEVLDPGRIRVEVDGEVERVPSKVDVSPKIDRLIKTLSRTTREMVIKIKHVSRSIESGNVVEKVEFPKSSEKRITVEKFVIEIERKPPEMSKSVEKDVRIAVESSREDLNRTIESLKERRGMKVYGLSKVSKEPPKIKEDTTSSNSVVVGSEKIDTQSFEINLRKIQSAVERVTSELEKRNEYRGRATVELEPPRLGRLEVEVVKENGKIRVELRVSSPEAKDMIEKRLDSLVSKLTTGGFNLDRVEVRLERYEESREENSDQRQQNQQDQGGYEDENHERRRKRNPFRRILNWEEGGDEA